MTRDVDPPGADLAALLQRTGLTLDFGWRRSSASAATSATALGPQAGSWPYRKRAAMGYFTVDAALGEPQGAAWMARAAP